ncbi:uncharacterized protein [Primulina eburnea]|uniref:uncharacterized protein n=1 Tax=Primulina eburnea TaxID=1245227 RepID=UPI003C6C4073
MASTIAAPTSQIPPHLIGKNYEVCLNNSIQSLLASLQLPNTPNSSGFISNFQELVQSKVDPPLEAIWVLTALSFNDNITPKNDSLNRIFAIKDLFQLIVSCSASCNLVKSIVLVAPVLCKLHYCILDVKDRRLGSKKEKKAHREIKSLVDSILAYLNVCSEGLDDKFDDLESLIYPLEDLVNLWISDSGVQNQNVDSLRAFFPLLSPDIVKRARVEGCGVMDLAGFVVAETILLKLCLKIREEGFEEKMQNELKYWLVGSITGFQSSHVYGTLMSMLLEPVLSIPSIVNPEYEDGLRKVLFGSLILVEYSFLSLESLGRLPAKHEKRIAFKKLMVTHEAIEFFGAKDQTKAIPYLNAFAISSLSSQIIKWVGREIGNESSASGPNGSSPRSFLRWMLNIENRGTKIFDDEYLKSRGKLILESSEEEYKQPARWEDGARQDSDTLFYIDNKGEEERGKEEDGKISESMNSAFMAAARSIQSSEQGRRKRKTKNGERRKSVKFSRFNRLDDSASLSGKRSNVPRNDDSNSGSEIEDPHSNEDMEGKD